MWVGDVCGLIDRLCRIASGATLLVLVLTFVACQLPQPPRPIGLIVPLNLVVPTPATLDVRGYFEDPNNDMLNYGATSADPAVATAIVVGSTLTVTPVSAGWATVTVTATNSKGQSWQKFSVTVVEPEPMMAAPESVGTIDNIDDLPVGEAIVVNVVDNFDDPDNQLLSYEATSSNERVATVMASPTGMVTVTAKGPGSATITVSATDEDDLVATQTFMVTVPVPPEPKTGAGADDRVMVFNPNGAALSNELFTLELGNRFADVYVISTNTTNSYVNAAIEQLDTAVSAPMINGRSRLTRELGFGLPGNTRPAMGHGVQQQPPISRSRSDQQQTGVSRAQSQSLGAPGDRFTFIDSDESGGYFVVPATARRVVTDTTRTLAVWVADREWGPFCGYAQRCLTQAMVDTIADRFPPSWGRQ